MPTNLDVLATQLHDWMNNLVISPHRGIVAAYKCNSEPLVKAGNNLCSVHSTTCYTVNKVKMTQSHLATGPAWWKFVLCGLSCQVY